MAKGDLIKKAMNPTPPPKKKEEKRVLGVLKVPKLDTVDKILLGTSSLAILGDWTTTMDGVRRRSEGWEETGPAKIFLGSHPSAGRVNSVVGTGMLLNALVGSQLSPTLRKILWGAVTGVEGYYALKNKQAGLNFNLSF